jgi:uncharacterized protein (DUF111 family)
MDAGALDVYTTAIQMKKNRPAVKITVLCRTADTMQLEQILFHETSALGIRRWLADRHTLERRPHEVATSWGPVQGKLAVFSNGGLRFSPEYESCRQVATAHGVPLTQVYQAAQAAFDPRTVVKPA